MDYKYDVTLSFAGEDRDYVEQVAKIIAEKGFKVFYDKFEEASLWGKDLGIHFEFVYRTSAKYCIPFISEHYADKIWTNYEIRNAISRAIETKEDYILPARFDDTEIEGLRSTIGYIDLRKYNPLQFSEIIIEKLSGKKDESVIQKEVEQTKIAEIYLSQNILLSDYEGVQGASIGVQITNLSKEYRYFAEPFFKTSYGIEGKYDTFYMTESMSRVNFPIKLEWGEPTEVSYKLKPGAIEHWKTLPKDATLKAVVNSTVGEKFESNEVLIRELTDYLR